MQVHFYKGRVRRALTLPNGEVVSLTPMREYLLPEGTKTSGIEGLVVVSVSVSRVQSVVDLRGYGADGVSDDKAVEPVSERPGLPFAAAVSEEFVGGNVRVEAPVVVAERSAERPKVPSIKSLRKKGSETSNDNG